MFLCFVVNKKCLQSNVISYNIVLGCDEHVSSSCLRSLVVRALER